jgi:hypothetical protein
MHGLNGPKASGSFFGTYHKLPGLFVFILLITVNVGHGQDYLQPDRSLFLLPG